MAARVGMLFADREVFSMKKLIVACLLMTGGQAGAAHPFGWEDMFKMVRLSDPQPSPDASALRRAADTPSD